MVAKNIAILFSGNGSNLENLYLKLHNKIFNDVKIEFKIAISSRKDAYGITRCNNLGLKCEILSSKENKENYDLKLLDILKPYSIDLVVLAGFMRILGDEVINAYKIINIHPSILPLFKGANAIVESYQSDMKVAGVSAQYVSSELDSGELIDQDTLKKIDNEDLKSFENRIHNLEYEIYPKAVLKVLLECKI